MPHPRTVTLSGIEVADRLRATLPEAVQSAEEGFVVLRQQGALEAMRFLRDDSHLDGKFLVQLCSVDMTTRIDMVYHFASLAQNHIFEVKLPCDHEQPVAPSISPLVVGCVATRTRSVRPDGRAV